MNRRLLIAILGSTSVLVLPVRSFASGEIDTGALDTPAISVRNPAGVLLVAIARLPGSRLVAVGEQGVIIFSDDEGLTWTQASVPVNLTLTCVDFATDMIGWAAGNFGVILNTTDGGKTWQVQLDGIQVNQLTLQAAQDPSVQSNPAPCAPLALKRAQRLVSDGPDKPFLTMFVLDTQKVVVFGAYRIAALTTDGGKTWVDWSLHIYDKFSHNIYSSATINGTVYLVAELGMVFSSVDGGHTFLPRPSPCSSTLFGVLGAKDGSLIVFGVAGNAFRSTDGGGNWAALSISTQTDLTGGRVLSSGKLVIVSEAGTLFESADNGATFNAVSGVQPEPFFDVLEARDGSLVAVGSNGVTRISKSLLAS